PFGDTIRLGKPRSGDPEVMAVREQIGAATHLFDGGSSGLRPVAREGIAARLERLAVLDRPAELLQRGVRAAVPSGTTRKDLLSGTWLGHPVHPPLTDIVIGSWSSALLLDL